MGFGLFRICFDKLENVSEIYPGHVPDILKMYSKHGQNISQICQHICQKMSRTYPTCLPDISKNVQTSILGKTYFGGKNDFGKIYFREIYHISYTLYHIYILYIYINVLVNLRCVQCPAHTWQALGPYRHTVAAYLPLPVPHLFHLLSGSSCVHRSEEIEKIYI